MPEQDGVLLGAAVYVTPAEHDELRRLARESPQAVRRAAALRAILCAILRNSLTPHPSPHRYVVPLLCAHINFYVRLFVRVRSGKARCDCYLLLRRCCYLLLLLLLPRWHLLCAADVLRYALTAWARRRARRGPPERR